MYEASNHPVSATIGSVLELTIEGLTMAIQVCFLHHWSNITERIVLVDPAPLDSMERLWDTICYSNYHSACAAHALFYRYVVLVQWLVY